jgi:hypothetical protein
VRGSERGRRETYLVGQDRKQKEDAVLSFSKVFFLYSLGVLQLLFNLVRRE